MHSFKKGGHLVARYIGNYRVSNEYKEKNKKWNKKEAK
jgi:hypothetical protein